MTTCRTLILGGVRSGKSRLAEHMASQSGLPVTYIATATAQDDEMRERIAAHRARRPKHWHLIEEPENLAAVLGDHAAEPRCVVVDCLTMWITYLLTAADSARWERERDALLGAVRDVTGQVILVSNETNMGVVPMGQLTRRYCDEAGTVHQALAQRCDRVVLTVAGIPLLLKGGPL